MRCGSKIAFVLFHPETRFQMRCELENGHAGNHRTDGSTEVYSESWEDGKYIETRKEEYLGIRDFVIEWENRPNEEGTIESKIQYWKTIGGNKKDGDTNAHDEGEAA